MLLARMKELVQQGKDFGFETTLAGKSYAAILTDMKRNGYRLHLFYLWLSDAELAVGALHIASREGGHDIPENVIRRRFDAGARNLVRFYLPLFDYWMLFDNMAMHPHVIARCMLKMKQKCWMSDCTNE